MEPFTITTAVWLAAGGFGLAGLLRVRAIWRRRAAPAAAASAPPAGAPEALLHRVELRMEAIEGLQAGLAARLEALAADDAAERRLQAMAGQLLGLVRDKDASLEVALAGLDQLRARMRMLEQIGDAAEARALFERLGVRIDAAETAQARTATTLETRLAAIEGTENPYAEISGQLTRLYAQKDATVETVFARLAPLEAKLAAVEGALSARDPAAALERFGERLEAARSAQEAAASALGERLAALEGTENPYAEISEQLTRLYAQKDATVETVFARLAPLEAKLAAVEGALAARDPAAALERFGERLEAARSAQEAAAAALRTQIGDRLDGIDLARSAASSAIETRLVALEGAENPYAEISDQLTRLYAQKDATVETVFARLAPLEAKLAAVEGALSARDPAAALERFGERLEAARSAQEAAASALGERLAALEGTENPYAEISEQLTRLYAQKDATVETVFARLAPLEAKLAAVEGALAARDPAAALERFGERLEAARGVQEAAAAALRTQIGDRLDGIDLARSAASSAIETRLAALEGAENPYAEISDQLTRLYAQKDATVETVFARLAPLEAKLADLERAGAADNGVEAARAEAQAIAVQLIAARTVAEETRLFASRIGLLEASLPRLSLAQALMMQALERHAAPADAGWPLAEAAPAEGGVPEGVPLPAPTPVAAPPDPAAAEAEDALWRLPRVVSVHAG